MTIFEIIEKSKQCQYCTCYKRVDVDSGHCTDYDIDVYDTDCCSNFEGGVDYGNES